MKKKILSILLCVAVTASIVAGCGTSTDENTKEEAAETTDESDVQADPVDTKKVFVTPEWVKSVIDGNQPESEKYLIVETYWGTEEESPDYLEGHIPGAIHVDTASVPQYVSTIRYFSDSG